MIGTIVILLPLLLVICKLVSEQSLQLEYSISDYYDNNMAGDMLTGILFVLGFLLLSYRGYEPIDSVAASLGCAFAVGVAAFSRDESQQICALFAFCFCPIALF
jgi:hypothetical protein